MRDRWEDLPEAPELKPDRDSWLAWRKLGLGGSDAAAVVGLSPWRTPMELWLEKTGRLEQQAESEAMLWGSLLEGPIADEFQRRSGLFVHSRQALMVHPDHPFMRATVDGLVTEGADGAGVLGVYEGKTSGFWGSVEWREGVPDHVQLQVQHNLAVSGFQHAWVVTLMQGQRLEVFELDADPELQALLVNEERRFWATVERDIPPPADGSEQTNEALRRAYPEPVVETVVLPDAAADLVAAYRAARADEKAAAERATAAQNQLMAWLGDAEAGVVAGRQLVTWKRYERKDVDLDGLRAAHAALVEQFTRTAGSRRFAITKEKS